MRERPRRGEDNTHTCVADLFRKKVGFSGPCERKTKAPLRLAIIFGLETKE
jgi:hypothetical protein